MHCRFSFNLILILSQSFYHCLQALCSKAEEKRVNHVQVILNPLRKLRGRSQMTSYISFWPIFDRFQNIFVHNKNVDCYNANEVLVLQAPI